MNQPEWISVEDRLPEAGGFVAYYESDQIGSMTIVSNYYPEEKYHFSHWMPLPEPPKPKGPTFKDVFLKAFPKAELHNEDGDTPICRVAVFGYGECNYESCAHCWNQPYFEPKEEGVK